MFAQVRAGGEAHKKNWSQGNDIPVTSLMVKQRFVLHRQSSRRGGQQLSLTNKTATGEKYTRSRKQHSQLKPDVNLAVGALPVGRDHLDEK